MESDNSIKIPEHLNVFDYKDEDLLHGTGLDNFYINGELNLIHHLLDKNCVVIEVGANKGIWTKSVLALTCPKMVYCFEPVPDNYNQLQTNHFFRDNVRTYPGAVGNMSGSVTFYYYSNNTEMAEMSNMYGRPQVEKDLNLKVEKINANITTLEEFLNVQDLEHVDFLKVDAEGAELAVLQGCGKLIDRFDYIQVESGGCYKDSGITLEEVFRLLSSYGFSIFRIVPEGLIYLTHWFPEFENYVHSNYLAMNKNKSIQFEPMKFEEESNE
jgi:FkbM family methyltransferase